MSRQSSHGRSMEHADQRREMQLPQLTQGPVRFVTANDGSRDCLALVVTQSLLTALNDIWEKKDRLDDIEGPLQHTELDIRGIEASIRSCKEALDTNANPSLVVEDQRFLEKQENKLVKLRQMKERLDHDSSELKRGIGGARAHADWALETALEESNLLRPRKSFQRPENSDIVDSYADSSREDSMVSTPPGSEEMRLRQADDDVSNCGYELNRAQTEFDNRENTYYKELDGYQRGLKDGTYDFSRTEFDRRMLAYGRDLTRDLIEAEENYEKAQTHREALGVRSSNGHSSILSHGYYEQSLSKDEVAAYITSIDHSSIEAWRADVPMTGIPEEKEVIGVEEPDAGLVQISDSASAADDGRYTKMINRWQKIRGVNEGVNRPRIQDPWNRDVEMLDRRHSS